tara:strand:- start:997 stop:1653 length:657 start_codon:yes stop_codon:yes gene_type:complete
MSEKTVQNEVNASRAASVGLIENVRLHVMWLVSFLTPTGTGNGAAPDMTTTHREFWSTQRLLEFVRKECFGLFDDSNPNRYQPNHPDGKTFGTNTADQVWLPKPIVNALKEAQRLMEQQVAEFGELWCPVRVQPGTVWFDVDEWASVHYDPMPLPDGTTGIMAEAYACVPDSMFVWKRVGGIADIPVVMSTKDWTPWRFPATDTLDQLDFWPEAPVDY